MDTAVLDPRLWTVLDGRYRVDRPIATGGMATVYAAHDLRLDRLVAVKVLHPMWAGDPEAVRRFVREARAAARLDHPAVVRVTDQGVDRGQVFLVMEHVWGRTLRDLLRERGRLTPAQALTVLDPVLDALAAAHAAGLVHRDVKPENVLIGWDGRVTVADFGLVRAVEVCGSDRTQGLLLGTAAYLAPEQVQHGVADPRSDVYAVGVLLFEMLTGTPPYRGPTPLAVAFRHVHESVPAPSTVRGVPPVPPELDALVKRATHRDPAGRPRDARALLGEARHVTRALALPPADLSTPPPHEARSVPAPDGTATPPAPGRTRRLLPPVGGGGRRPPAGPAPRFPPRRAAAPARGRTPRPGTGALRAASLLAVVLVALVGGGWWWQTGRWAAAPELLALPQADAVSLAGEHGLRVRFGEPVYSESVAPGLIAAQQPAPGDRVHRGGPVTLALSRGPERVAIPAVNGQLLTAARAALLQARLTVGEVTSAYDDRVPEGQVLRTDPAAGATVRPGSAVTVVVSQGRPPVDLPDLTGQDVDAARSSLQASGLVVTAVSRYSDAPAGQVIGQDPSGPVTVRRGDQVTLTVSEGPELVVVPNVRGQSKQRALATLQAAGLVGRVGFDLPAGFDEVLRVSPGQGTRLPRGSTVTIDVF